MSSFGASQGMNMVINYDVTQSAVSYIHRIGRTGRAGRHGVAVTLFTESDMDSLRSIANVMRLSGCKVRKRTDPNDSEYAKVEMMSLIDIRGPSNYFILGVRIKVGCLAITFTVLKWCGVGFTPHILLPVLLTVLTVLPAADTPRLIYRCRIGCLP